MGGAENSGVLELPNDGCLFPQSGRTPWHSKEPFPFVKPVVSAHEPQAEGAEGLTQDSKAITEGKVSPVGTMSFCVPLQQRHLS